LHLGRPLGAWRAFLGLRTSWMSREIVAFGVFAGAASLLTAAAIWSLPVPLSVTASATAGLGLLGIFCSAMIYVDTRRAFWNASLVFTRFFGAALLLGSAGCAATLAWLGSPVAGPFILAAMMIQTALFGWESRNLRRSRADEEDPNHRSA